MDMSDCNWGEGVALWGFNHSLPYAPNDAYLPFLKEWVERGLREKRFQHTVNTSIPCIGIGEVYKQTNQKSLLDFMVQQADFLLYDAPRLKNGAIIHTDPLAEFGRQMWADTVFMAGLYLAYMGKLTGNAAYIEEAMKQWGRANAWVSVGIVEMMDYADVEPELIQALKKQLDGIGQYQKENGLWRTVLNGTMSYLEASSAYGFGYAILKGIRLGVLEPSYFALVEKMQKTLIENVDADGKVMNISAGTPVMRNEPEYNIICEHRIQPWGQGLALLYFSEAMEAEKAHAL